MDIIQVRLSKDGNILFLNLSNQLGTLIDNEIKILNTPKSIRHYLACTKTKDYILESKINKNIHY
jgi:hypothetical protein